jgi:hypothetical protein
MRKILKVIRILIVVLVVPLALYLGFNQLDAPTARFEAAAQYDTSSFEAFRDSLFPPANFDKNNGYYRLWTLLEPEGVDIRAPEVLMKYRRLHDPALDREKNLKEWMNTDENRFGGKAYKGAYETFRKRYIKIIKKNPGLLDPSRTNSMSDWSSTILAAKETLKTLQSDYRPLNERYREMLNSEVFEDFTYPSYDAPVPNLLCLLHVGKVYIVSRMLEAMEGNWKSGVDGLLLHVSFLKKAILSGRTIILDLVNKALLRQSLFGLNSLMNRPEFPRELYKKILRGLLPIEYPEYGSEKQLMFEGFSISQVKEEQLLFQENRTRQYFYDFFTQLIDSEKTPPYKWKMLSWDELCVKKGFFWWVQNPSGKNYYQKWLGDRKDINNFVAAIQKSHYTRALYDMTRISAELRMHYREGKKVKTILERLDTYRTSMDPFSGKPYTWNEKKQILYSFGPDMDDDGGAVDYRILHEDKDIVLPIILYIGND